MRQFSIPFILLSLFFGSCGNTGEKKVQSLKSNKMTNEHLLSCVRLAINPKYQDWVLFQNGTYIIFDNADTIANVKEEAIKLMKEYGPVFGGGPAGDFGVTHLNQTEGWVVSGHGYGMYTYVSPNELNSEKPDDAAIGLYGRSKRDLDGKDPIIIHINRKTK